MQTHPIHYYTFETRIGTMVIGCDEHSVTHLYTQRRNTSKGEDFGSLTSVSPAPHTSSPPNSDNRYSRIADMAIGQVTEYLEGTRREFTLPLAPQGTPFQQKVWAALGTIPYGETRCYSEIAKLIGNPKACRAVGMANNRNPIMILIPCHRVIGKNGSLVGYGSGLDIKQRLLELEGALP